MKRTVYLAFALTATLVIGQTSVYGQAPLGSDFTYQGRLMDAGLPADGDYDFVFRLYDAATDGVQISSDFPVDDWPVIDGLFTVQVDFGASAFNSEARWLEVAVRPWDSNDPHTVLSPRQPVTAAPVALYALDGPGSGGYWTLNGDDIYNTNSGNVGIGTTSPQGQLEVLTADEHAIWVTTNHIPVLAYCESTSGTWPAIHGECDSEHADGSAVRGIMTSTSPGIHSAAVRGINNGTGGSGIGVYGSQDGAGWGVLGTTPDGIGVQGSSDEGYGVCGFSGGTGGIGVYGWATATEGITTGVFGAAFSPDGYAGYFNGRGCFMGNVGIRVQDPQASLDVYSYSGQTAIQGVAGITSGTGVYQSVEELNVASAPRGGRGFSGQRRRSTSATEGRRYFFNGLLDDEKRKRISQLGRCPADLCASGSRYSGARRGGE